MEDLFDREASEAWGGLLERSAERAEASFECFEDSADVMRAMGL